MATHLTTDDARELLVSNEAIDYRDKLIAKLRESILIEAARITRGRHEGRITQKDVEEATEAVLKNFWALVHGRAVQK